LVAVFVGAAFLTVSLPLAGLHVHARTPSADSAHDHGPAVHTHEEVDHHAVPSPDIAVDGALLGVATQDALGRVIPCSFTCVTRTMHVGGAAVSSSTTTIAPLIEKRAPIADTDRRTHSPPRWSDGPLRAPPSSLLA
jgi:hypothetical protein